MQTKDKKMALFLNKCEGLDVSCNDWGKEGLHLFNILPSPASVSRRSLGLQAQHSPALCSIPKDVFF